MDDNNKTNLPGQNEPEEPPLQQTPEILNQQMPEAVQPIQPTQQPAIEPPQQQPQQLPNNSPKKKKLMIVLVVVMAVVLLSIIAGMIYWVTTLNTINSDLEEQSEAARVLEGQRIETADELKAAYENKSALDCNFNVTKDGKSYEINEQANADWKSHKYTMVGDDSTITTLSIEGDAVYMWGYTDQQKTEIAFKIPWDQYTKLSTELENSEVFKQFSAEQTLEDAEKALAESEMLCYAKDSGADYSVPERDWLDFSSLENVL